MVICADTSFLFALYGNDAHTARAIAWVKARRLPLTLTILAEYEFGNALRFAEFRKAIDCGDAAAFWSEYEKDRDCGRLRLPVCNLAAVVQEARRLSVKHTLAKGHRAFDLLHVAGALHLGAQQFLTFDAKQRQVAEAEGLGVPV